MRDNDMSRREILAATGAVVAAAAVAEPVRAADDRAEAKPIPMVPGKLYVITDARGTVIGTASVGSNNAGNAPTVGLPAPEPGGRIHVIDHTPALQRIQSPDELHKAVAGLIR